jgi:para-nitrobenzyl esterase
MDIWKPAKLFVAPIPIAIFIHGGSNYFGSADSFIGSHIVQKDVIIIFIQYRLGLMGFLNTWSDDKLTETTGNFGLLDQQLAIEFIKENAGNIGGDPDRITILGESAGAQDVSYQEMLKVLFLTYTLI